MKYIVFTLIGIALGLIITVLVMDINLNQPVQLPEEYQLITEDTPIKGHFEGKTLIIEFDHQYK